MDARRDAREAKERAARALVRLIQDIIEDRIVDAATIEDAERAVEFMTTAAILDLRDISGLDK